MYPRLAFVMFAFIASSSYAQTANFSLTEMRGHVIGESVADLLNKEPDVLQQFNSCKQHAHDATCDRLLAGFLRGQRGRVSTSNWMTFVVDGGKLVKLQILIHGSAESAKTDLTKRYGPQSSETAFPMQNAMGAKWEDHLSVWDTPVVYVGLREDNNPASQNHHLVLVVESREEQARAREEEMKAPNTVAY